MHKYTKKLIKFSKIFVFCQFKFSKAVMFWDFIARLGASIEFCGW